MDAEFSTGQTSRLLHVSQARVLRWCNEGLIECSTTAGGHYRIPQRAISAIEKNGAPELPHRPARSTGGPVSRATAAPPPSGLYRDASDALAESAESVEIVSNRVRRRQLELEDAQLDDEFEERARRKAAEEAEDRRLLAEARAGQEQQEWLQGKLAYALARLPQHAPLDLQRRAYDAALKFLQDTDRRIVPDAMVNAFLDHSVQMVVRIYDQRQAEIRRHEEEARQRTMLENLNGLVRIVAASEAQEARQLQAFFAIAPPPLPAPAPQLAAPQLEAASVDRDGERQARRRAAADRADGLLKHVNTHLRKYEFSGGWPEQRAEGERLRMLIREPLIARLLADPAMDNRDGRAFVEREIEERIS
jgi:hypothetical protein